MVISEIKDFADDIELDNMGNVIVLKKGKSNKKKVMIGAHMDEIGFIVTHIDNNGFLKFHTLGDLTLKLNISACDCSREKDIIGVMGSKPIHVMSPKKKIRFLRLLTTILISVYLKKKWIKSFQ